MKTLNLIFAIMLISFSSINFSLSESELDKQENYSVNKSEMNMPPPPPEDVTGDNVVDIEDLAICLMESANFCTNIDPVTGNCTMTTCQADITGDCFVDLSDVILIYNYICTHLNQ